MERETSEMGNFKYQNLKDTRKLLLDYSQNRGVLLKLFTLQNYSNYYKFYFGVNFF